MATESFFNTMIPGLGTLLFEDPAAEPAGRSGKLRYFVESGLTIVILGAAGTGKTILALQMAVAAAKSGKQVLYFTKDTPSAVLRHRVCDEFDMFGIDALQVHSHDAAAAIEVANDGVTDDATSGHQARRIDCHTFDEHFQTRAIRTPRTSAEQHDYTECHRTLSFPFLAFIDFEESPLTLAGADRYSTVTSTYDALAQLSPKLRPLFECLGSKRAPRMGLTSELVIVCDALSPTSLEEHLHFRMTAPTTTTSDKNAQSHERKPVLVFVMESATLPSALSVAFPPDVQMSLGLRVEESGSVTHTLRLLKTRFQRSIKSEATFMIMDKTAIVGRGTPLSIHFGKGQDTLICERTSEAKALGLRPGLCIIPPLPDNQEWCNRLPVHRRATYGIAALDYGVDSDEEGGCTLLVTKSGCGATPLALHYLLGDAQSQGAHNRAPPSMYDLLYIGFCTDIVEILHTLWRYERLRHAIRCPNDLNVLASWRRIKDRLPSSDPPGNWRYRVPLVNPGGNSSRSLHIITPQFSWMTPEHAAQWIGRTLLLNSTPRNQSGGIGRVVLDRVGRLNATWPLVEQSPNFISQLLGKCASLGIEMMLIDDTAAEDPATGGVLSRWMSHATDVLRLRRIGFQGAESVVVELASMTGAGRPIHKRVLELVERGNPAEYRAKLDAVDTFKGYTGVATGKPVRCKIKVDLSFDATNTPLCREVMAMKSHLQAAMDDVEVLLLGRGEWSGINSAFSNLSSESRDICHVVAIDGIWLEALVRSEVPILHDFSDLELVHLLPEHISRHCQRGAAIRHRNVGTIMDTEYVTRAESIAMDARMRDMPKQPRKEKNSGTTAEEEIARSEDPHRAAGHFAIPMRHNWGVLAVTTLSRMHMRHVFATACPGLLSTSRAKKPSPNGDTREATHESEQSGLVLKLLQLRNHTPERLDDSAQRVVDLLCHGAKGVVGWTDIADVRTDYWHPFWEGKELAKGLARMRRDSAGNRTQPWLALFPRVDLFGLVQSPEESVVSFFLELLLATNELNTILSEKDSQRDRPAVLYFRKCCDSFVNTLLLFYRLLAPTQRRQLGIGVTASQADIGTPIADCFDHARGKEDVFRDSPRQVCLLSRQWITTVEDLQSRYDIRESIEMQPLPGGEGAASFWERVDVDVARGEWKRWGPTVAGAWYLGVLRGGNVDLAGTVMKTILSEEQERLRLLNRAGAPVSLEIYPGKSAGRDRRHRLPYVDVIRQMNSSVRPSEKMEDKQVAAKRASSRLYFPFHRNQIANYLKVSPIIYDLIRNVMRLPIAEEAALMSPGRLRSARLGRMKDGLKREIERQVRRSFDHLSKRDVNAVYEPNEATNNSNGAVTPRHSEDADHR